MKDPIKDTIQQTRRYWYVDGLTELATGTLFLVLSLFYIIIGLIGPGSTAGWLETFGVPAIILIGGLAGRWGVSRLKERLTYPRTGYVAYRDSRIRLKVLSVLIALLVSALFVGAMFFLKIVWLDKAIPTVIAAILIAFVGQNYGLRRFYWLAVYILLLGLPMTLLQLSDMYMLALFVGGCGLGFLVSGGITLRNYLRAVRLPAEEME
jgi:hypothetical protein